MNFPVINKSVTAKVKKVEIELAASLIAQQQLLIDDLHEAIKRH